MKSICKRLLAWCLCLVLCAGLLPLPSKAVDAATDLTQQHYGGYATLSTIYNQGDCFSMQGMTLDSTYTYCAKVNTDTDASACIIRTNKSTGAKTVMINGATGGYYFTNLGHANCLDLEWIGSYNQMLVTAGNTLVRLKLSGSTLTTLGTYTAAYNGSSISMTAVQIMNATENEVKVLVKNGRTLYTGTFDPTASSGVIQLTKLCTFNISAARLKGETYDFSSYLQQGMDYHDGKLFLPLSGNTQMDTSVVLVYDLEGAAGEIKNDPTLSFRVISSSYAALFEIEDVAICTETGRLYFNTNRRQSSSDTDHDSCSYFTGYSYNPSMSTLAPGDYRWETVNNELVSVTTGGATFNKATQFYGHFTNNVMTNGLFSLSRSVILKHDSPWVVEWKSSGTFFGGALLMATARIRNIPNAPYLFRSQDSKFIGIGYYSGSSYNNYGICLSDHGIDASAEHTYRLTNKITNGSNMVYLSVDGKELGALNNHFVGTVSQGTTSNWISGQDFTFNYFGSYMHPIDDCKLDYLQVWAEGEPSEAKNYRWETSDSDLISTAGSNDTTIYNGSVSESTYNAAAFRLDAPVKLLHDREWIVEWEAEGSFSGGTFLLSAAEGGANKNSPYLFRYSNGLVALGSYDGSKHNNYGIMLTDHNIDLTQKHTYQLRNRVATDGSNMVYLSVDGTQLGAMNNVFEGLNAQNTTSDWLNGKDLTFDYLGNTAYPMNGTYSYLDVQEEFEGEQYTITFRDYNGCLISTQTCREGQMPTPPADPQRNQDVKYTYTFSGWSPAITAADGDREYVATYKQETRSYTVTFKNEDGAILKTQTLPYGQMPAAPEDPVKEGVGNIAYTFSGWYPTIAKVTGDAVYTAQYTEGPKQCVITFVNDDGTVISRQVLDYGAMPTAPAAPTKAPTVSHSYTFVGWDAALTAATFDMTYTARYVSSLRKYTVIFKNTDGTVLSQQTVPYGYAPTAPSTAPTRNPDPQSHYSFIGWTPSVSNVSADATYTAIYKSSAHSFRDTTVAATCTVPGKITHTCTSCGYSYNETLPAKGHSYSAKVTAPTCTASGYTTYTCACGDRYTGNQTAATGHSYSAGKCTACGAVDPNYNPGVTKPTLTLKSPTLEFKDMITVNAFYTAENIQDVVEMGMITYSTNVSTVDIATAEHVIPGATYVESSGRYYSSSQGIHAKYLGDTVYLAIYAKLSDGSYAYSKLAPYSAVQYANSQLKNSTDAKLKQLVVAMLNYGAEAQLYFGHNTGALANAALTADQKALPETYRADMVGSVPAASATKQGIFANNSGFASRKPAISFEGAFCINYFFTPKYEPSSGITLYYWNAEDYNANDVLTAANATGKFKLEGSGTEQYRGDITGIAAKELSSAVYVACAYKDSSGTVWTSGVLGYSIGAYCSGQASKGGSIAGLAQATAVYGYHAKQYFG